MDFTGGGRIVFKHFKPPGKNKCAMLQAFDPATPGFGISSTACTASTGRYMKLHYTLHNWEGTTEYFEAATCRILLPATAGNLGLCDGSFLSSPGGQGGFAQSAVFHACAADIPE